MLHKEDLEKMRLRNRREGFFKYAEGGITPGPDSAQYIPDADRFITDVAGQEKRDRELMLAQKKELQEVNRKKVTEQEEARWRAIEDEYAHSKRREEEMRIDGAFGKSNKNSMPYDPITLNYLEGRDGECLRYSDEALNYRGALRAQSLQSKTNNGYNPITGERVPDVSIPEPPKPPSFMVDDGTTPL